MRANLKMHQKVLIALVALITMGLLLAVGVWAYDDAQKDQIAPGVKVGGVDVGGRDADSARKIIKNQVVAPAQAAGGRQLRRQGLHAQPQAPP